MKNAVSDGYFVPARYQTPPGPNSSPRRRPQRRLGPVIRQRLDTLEERRRRADGERRASGVPQISRSATELGQKLPKVYAGVATVTDLTAPSSSVDTLFSRDESSRAGGDLECLALDANEETEPDLTEVSDDVFGERETLSSDAEDIPCLELDDGGNDNTEVSEAATYDPSTPAGGRTLVARGEGSYFRGTEKNEVAMIVSQKWKRRLDNNRSVLNLCRRISLIDQRKVDDRR